MQKKPVHPILVHFPIALLVTAFVADAAYWLTSLPTLRHAGFWMMAVAALTGALAVLAGIFDMRRASLEGSVHERVHRHMHVGFGLYAVICALTFWRWTFFAPDERITVLYLDFTLLAVALAAFQGWLGGELVYTHGVFVAKKQASAEPATPAPAEAASGHHSH